MLNPARVIEEIDELASRGAGHAENLRISDRAHVIFPWHFAEDRALDKSTSDGENIGTTGRGIGPCYRDKVGRSHAIRLGDLYRPTFRAQVEHIVAAKNRVLEVLDPAGEFKPLDASAIIDEYTSYAERLQPYVGDTTELLLAAAETGKRMSVRRRPRGAARRRPRHVPVRHQQQQLGRRHRQRFGRAGAAHRSQSSAS